MPADPVASQPAGAAEPAESSESEIERVLTTAATSPRAGLMQLAAALEREARRLLAATGHLVELGRGASLTRMAEALERATAMPRGSLDVFPAMTFRNTLSHASFAIQLVGDGGGPPRAVVMQFKKGRPRSEGIAPAMIDGRTHLAQDLFRRLLDVTKALLEVPHGDEGVKRFEEW